MATGPQAGNPRVESWQKQHFISSPKCSYRSGYWRPPAACTQDWRQLAVSTNTRLAFLYPQAHLLRWALTTAFHKLTIHVCPPAHWGTLIQARRLRVWFPMVSLEYFIDITLPAALWPWGRLSVKQKWVTGIYPGGKVGRCVGLTEHLH
jgi:hypothetical protein